MLLASLVPSDQNMPTTEEIRKALDDPDLPDDLREHMPSVVQFLEDQDALAVAS